MFDYYDLMADIHDLEYNKFDYTERQFERKIERLFGRIDRAYMKNELTTEQYDNLSIELSIM